MGPCQQWMIDTQMGEEGKRKKEKEEIKERKWDSYPQYMPKADW